MRKLPKLGLPVNPVKTIRVALSEGHKLIDQGRRDIRSVAEDLHSFSILGHETPTMSHESPAITPSTSSLTNEDIIAHQNREIGTELWLLEKHLAQGCRISDKTGKRVPCDCCEKGSFIAGLAYESIPIAERGGKSSAVYEKIARWANEMEPLVTVPAIESGKYDYKKLAGQASALRKELMGTLALGALLSPAARREVADRASKIVEEEVI